MGSGSEVVLSTGQGRANVAQLRSGAEAGGAEEITTTVEFENVLDLSMPDLKPADNADQIITEKIVRRRFPVKITNVDIYTTANGYRVRVPMAGQENMFGPDGVDHVFTSKGAMLEFVGTVIGQIAYRYRDEVLHTAVNKSEVVGQDEACDSPG